MKFCRCEPKSGPPSGSARSLPAMRRQSQACPSPGQGDSLEEAHDNLIEALERFCETAPDNKIQDRHKGSHIIMQKDGQCRTVTVPVPNHRELRAGTLRSIVRQSGLARTLFEEGK